MSEIATDIECTNYRYVGKGAVVGFINIFVPKWGLEINDITLFMKDGRKWISFPCRMYEKDGEKKYFPYIRFKNKDHSVAFQNKVLDALDKFCSQNSSESVSTSSDDMEIPF